MKVGSARNFIFRRVYDMAALVEECVGNPASLIELEWSSEDVLKCLVDFQKSHYFTSIYFP